MKIKMYIRTENGAPKFPENATACLVETEEGLTVNCKNKKLARSFINDYKKLLNGTFDEKVTLLKEYDNGRNYINYSVSHYCAIVETEQNK